MSRRHIHALSFEGFLGIGSWLKRPGGNSGVETRLTFGEHVVLKGAATASA